MLDHRNDGRAVTAQRLTFAPPGLSLAAAKAGARRAYGQARAAGGVYSLILDQLWSQTLLAVENQPAATAAEMYFRSEHLFILLRDRASWPR